MVGAWNVYRVALYSSSLFGLLFIVVPVFANGSTYLVLVEIENLIYERDFLRTIFIRSTRYACYFAIFIAFESDFWFISL